MPELTAFQRHAARVLLLDRAGRILLLRFFFDPADPGRGCAWVAPGGGVNAGEPVHHAAARELREEIGLTVPPHDLGRPVAYTTGHAEVGEGRRLFRDDFFHYRVDAHEVDISGMETFERSTHAGYRWWSLDELARTADTVYPLGLAALLADLTAGRIPDQPVQLPWHH